MSAYVSRQCGGSPGNAICSRKYWPSSIGRVRRALSDRMFEAYDRRIRCEADRTLVADDRLTERKPLKICFVVDARSPIACDWIPHFIQPAHHVHVISSYPCSAKLLT